MSDSPNMADTSQALINPMAYEGAPSLGPLGFMAATLPDVQDTASKLSLHKHRHLPLSKVYAPKGEEGFCLTGPFMGAPYAVYVLEQLIAWGVEKVIFLGWCGSLSPDLGPGDLLVPDSAFVDEGTTPHYGAPGKGRLERSFPDDGWCAEVVSAIDSTGHTCARGPVWTTDAVFRETREKVEHFQNKGALAVEMELSALQTVAAFRNVPLAGLLVVSDELHTGTWKPGFGDPKFQEGRRHAIEVLCKICHPV